MAAVGLRTLANVAKNFEVLSRSRKYTVTHYSLRASRLTSIGTSPHRRPPVLNFPKRTKQLAARSHTRSEVTPCVSSVECPLDCSSFHLPCWRPCCSRARPLCPRLRPVLSLVAPSSLPPQPVKLSALPRDRLQPSSPPSQPGRSRQRATPRQPPRCHGPSRPL